jgi:hypothetical protein
VPDTQVNPAQAPGSSPRIPPPEPPNHNLTHGAALPRG